MPTRELQIGKYYFNRGFCDGVIVKIISIGQGKNPRCCGKVLDLSTDGGLLTVSTNILKTDLDLSREVTPADLEKATKEVISRFQVMVDEFWKHEPRIIEYGEHLSNKI